MTRITAKVVQKTSSPIHEKVGIRSEATGTEEPIADLFTFGPVHLRNVDVMAPSPASCGPPLIWIIGAVPSPSRTCSLHAEDQQRVWLVLDLTCSVNGCTQLLCRDSWHDTSNVHAFLSPGLYNSIPRRNGEYQGRPDAWRGPLFAVDHRDNSTA